MPAIPRERAPDSTRALFADPYHFIAKRARAHDSDVFEARILLRPTLCMTGPHATRLFYDSARFTRAGAAPMRLQKTLFGRGGVQGLDGKEHQHRKRMLLTVLHPDRVGQLGDRVAQIWQEQARQWGRKEQVVLYDEMREILTRAVCTWAGVPLPETEVKERTAQLSNMYAGAGSVGPKHWLARRHRERLEAHLADLIADVRAGRHAVPTDTALAIVANHRDPQGQLLDVRVAAVELLNILRPTVAIAVYVTHLAHALHAYPEARARLREPGYATAFVQEVRRLYPFFPSVAARVRTDFDWQGYHFPAGRRVLLDLHGSNRDPRVWTDPLRFDPQRFLGRPHDPYVHIPQGGGDAETDHRCAGEPTTVSIMEMALRMLSNGLVYDVPTQDLEIDETALPALPQSGFVMTDVRQAGPGLVAPMVR